MEVAPCIEVHPYPAGWRPSLAAAQRQPPPRRSGPPHRIEGMNAGLLKRIHAMRFRFDPRWLLPTLSTWFWQYLVKPVSESAYHQHWMNVSEWGDPDFDESWEGLQVIETQRWLKRARRVHLGLDSIPLPDGRTSHWEPGRFSPDGYVPDATLRQLKVLVEAAEGERITRRKDGAELWTKWITAIAAVVAAIASVWNLFLSRGR